VTGHIWPTGHQFDTCALQLAAAQQCLSKASPNTFFPLEKVKIFNTKAMVACKRSAAVVKKLTSKTKKQTEVASGCYWPCALCGCHGKHIQSTVPLPTISQVMTKK